MSAAAGPWVVSERSGCFWFLGGEMKLHEALTERGAALSLACFLFSSSLIIFSKWEGQRRLDLLMRVSNVFFSRFFVF